MEINEDVLQSMIQQAGRQDVTRYQLECDTTLQNIELSLRGYRKKTIKGRNEHDEIVFYTDWVKTAKPTLNEDGVNFIMRFLSEILTKEVILSDLEEREIQSMTIYKHRILWKHLFKKRHDYDLQLDSIDTLVDNLMDLIYVTLKRALHGRERTGIAETRQISEQRVLTNENQEQKSKWQSILPMGGN